MDNFWLAIEIVGGIVLAWVFVASLIFTAVCIRHEYKMWRTWRIIATNEARRSAEEQKERARIFRIR